MPIPQNGQTHSTIRRQQPTSCLNVFDHFVKLALKGLSTKNQALILLCGSQINNSESLNQEIFKNVISYLKVTTHFDRLLINF